MVLGVICTSSLFSQQPPSPEDETQGSHPGASVAQTSPFPQTAPASADGGTLLLSLSGNRKFCVSRNELGFSKETLKPRDQSSGPLITTMGYKYQISVSRKGSPGVTKLMESPTIKTAYLEKVLKPKEPPQPRLPTAKELKKSPTRYGTNNAVRWIASGTCTTLRPEYSFPLPVGRYDIYLGFDLLAVNGQWTPLESDFVTNVPVEKGKTSRVNGTVDYTNGSRTVKLEVSQKSTSAGDR